MRICRGVGASNGGRFVTREYSVAPSEYTSLRRSQLLPSACSGDMNAGVPMTWPSVVSVPPLLAERARPKSITKVRRVVSEGVVPLRSWVIMMLCGLMSRWMMSRAWA